MTDIPKAHRPYGACYDCGRRYGEEFGFPDLMVPTEVWKQISPTGTEGGLLCPCCIVRRCVFLGIETEARWMSGPFAQRPADPEADLAFIEGRTAVDV